MSFSLFKTRHCDTDSKTVSNSVTLLTTRYVKWPGIIYILAQAPVQDLILAQHA